MMKILVAEQDPHLAGFMAEALMSQNYGVALAQDGAQAERLALAERFDLMVLDLGSRRGTGAGLLVNLRAARPDLPVLVLSEGSKVEERVEILDAGADDLLAKPFAVAELNARIRALLRRGVATEPTTLMVSDLKLDRILRRVERGGNSISLSTKEFALLEYLMLHAGRAVSRAQIIVEVWHLATGITTNVVDVYINFSSSQVDKPKVGKIAKAVQVAFQDLGIFAPSGTQVPVGDESPVPFNNVQTSQSAGTTGSLGKFVPNAQVKLGGSAETAKAQLQKQVEKVLQKELVKQEVHLRSGPDGLVISLGEVGFFDSGSAHLKDAALPTVAKIAATLQSNGYSVQIEGHSDGVPIHNAQFASNWELSSARATELTRLLIEKYGIPPERLSAAGYAEYHPIADNATEGGRTLNRRVDIILRTPVQAKDAH